jgi:hypothetical protein
MRIIISLIISFSLLTGCANDNWRDASRAPAGIAPDAASTKEAVILVYGASAWGWRGWFAIHTWIATKPTNAHQYTVYEVVGWRVRHGLPALSVRQDFPDRYWYGEKPELILQKQGDGIDLLIAKIQDAVARYPWKDTYRVFPGPNSNTFPAWIAKEVPELNLQLPFSAIGSGWADNG